MMNKVFNDYGYFVLGVWSTWFLGYLLGVEQIPYDDMITIIIGGYFIFRLSYWIDRKLFKKL